MAVVQDTDYVAPFARAGFPLIELNGKVPLHKEWQHTLSDILLTSVDLTPNYGVVLPPDYLVIDVDCKNNKVGKVSFARLCTDLGLNKGWEAETFVVQTGSGGFHIYLKKSPDVEIRKTVKEYPDIEFLSKGCFVVGPGSIHPDTNQAYKIIFKSVKEIKEVPDSLLDLIAKPKIVDTGVKAEQKFVDDDPLNVERFIELLIQMPSVPKGNQRNSCYIAACRGRDLALSEAKCVEILKKYYNGVKLTPPIQDDEVTETVLNAYKYAKGMLGMKNVSAIFQVVEVEKNEELQNLKYDQNSKGGIQKTLNNAINYIITLPELSKTFRYNIFSDTIELDSAAPWYLQRGSRSPAITDNDIVLLKYFLAKTFNIEFDTATLWEAVTVVGHRRHYHPVRNYLKSLRWDGKHRIDKWLTTYGGAIDTVYTRAIARKVLCAGVKRVFDPGCKWDYVLIIEGAQGIGKSTMCRILGRIWGGDMNLDPHTKDSIAMMMGKWIIELSEMVALKWADANALKSFLSREKDTVRAAYQRLAKDYLRQSIFIGTVNPEHVGYLNDMTGNRRFWIVHFPGQIKIMDFENDCDQLWAEAMQIYEREPLYLSGEAEQLQAVEAQARMPEEPMRRHVINFTQENPDVVELTIIDLLEYVGIPAKNASKNDMNRLAQAIIDAGWIRDRVEENGRVKTVYKRPIQTY